MQKILANELTVCAACVRRILVIAVACKTARQQHEAIGDATTSAVLPLPFSNSARYGMEATTREAWMGHQNKQVLFS